MLREEAIELIYRRMAELAIPTQASLAMRAELSESHLSKVLSRQQGMSVVVLERLASALQLPPAVLLFPPGPGIANSAELWEQRGGPKTEGPSNPEAGSSSQPGQVSNIRGRVDELRDPQVRPLPVYRWGAAGDPRSAENAPDPDRLEYPPLGRELLIGPRGFAVDVKGASMVNRNIREGDMVWVNPDRAPRVGGVVVAHARSDDGDQGMVVKVLSQDDVGQLLMSDPEDGERLPVDSDYFEVIGPVVWIQPPGYPPG